MLRKPLGGIHPETLADLLALSETEGLPVQMTRDLERFREQMIREVNDLPDGAPLEEFIAELLELEGSHVPETLRQALAAREEEPALKAPAAAALAGFRETLAEVDPEPVEIVERKKVSVQRPTVPSSHRSPQERERSRTRSPSGRATPRATPAAAKDERREEWIREDLLSRLQGYGSNGLKQAILIAGAKHRAPFSDLTDDEIRAVLRKLGREGLIKHSAGRWSAKGARF
ncbi:MAG: hypothetical protein H6741_15850 [Alphaproteobacteria bacterium]|nr:hypothetical protein [Alphaproteobacteria bacterium]